MSSNSNSNNSELPRNRGRSVIRGGSGKVLYDSTKDDQSSQGKSSSTIYSSDGKRILHEDKKE